VDAVGGDEHARLDRVTRARVRPVGERGAHAARAGLEALQVCAQTDALGAQARARRLEELHLQDAPVNRDLRPAVAGAQAARLGPDALAALGVVGELGARDPRGFERCAQPELVQLAHRVRQEVDADAERPQLGHRLEHAHREACLGE
jgi:hypothetical protein